MRGAAFTLAQASRIAAKRFGVRALRPEQRRALEAVAAGRDVLVVQPTGSGKSLDYQLAAMLLPGKAVSPSTLALSAQVTTASARAVLATLLERGLLSRDGETYRLAISTAEFAAVLRRTKPTGVRTVRHVQERSPEASGRVYGLVFIALQAAEVGDRCRGAHAPAQNHASNRLYNSSSWAKCNVRMA